MDIDPIVPAKEVTNPHQHYHVENETHTKPNHSRKGGTDTSMPDYVTPDITSAQLFDGENGEHSDLEQMLSAPTNTPTSLRLISQEQGTVIAAPYSQYVANS